MQEVTITSRRGVPRIEVKGVAGSACKTLTRELEGALGDVKTRKATPDAYRTATQGDKLSH